MALITVHTKVIFTFLPWTRSRDVGPYWSLDVDYFLFSNRLWFIRDSWCWMSKFPHRFLCLSQWQQQIMKVNLVFINLRKMLCIETMLQVAPNNHWFIHNHNIRCGIWTIIYINATYELRTTMFPLSYVCVVLEYLQPAGNSASPVPNPWAIFRAQFWIPPILKCAARRTMWIRCVSISIQMLQRMISYWDEMFEIDISSYLICNHIIFLYRAKRISLPMPKPLPVQRCSCIHSHCIQ